MTKPVATDAILAGKSILVTGGSGFIGRALCKTFVESGASVTVLTRDILAATKKIIVPVNFIDSMQRLKKSDTFDVIVNLAGERIVQRWTQKAKERILQSRLVTTRNIVQFVRDADKRPTLFISSSAIGYYGTDDNAAFTETSTPAQGGEFSKEICREWEQAALEAQQFGVRTVLLRTGVTLEKDGGTLSQMLFPFYFSIGGKLGEGRQWFSWIHRNDLIGIILHIIGHASIEGPINATAPQPVSNDAFVKELGRAMKRPSFMPMPSVVLRAIFGEMADEIMLKGQKVLPEIAQQTGYQFKYPSIEKALEAIFS